MANRWNCKQLVLLFVTRYIRTHTNKSTKDACGSALSSDLAPSSFSLLSIDLSSFSPPAPPCSAVDFELFESGKPTFFLRHQHARLFDCRRCTNAMGKLKNPKNTHVLLLSVTANCGSSIPEAGSAGSILNDPLFSSTTSTVVSSDCVPLINCMRMRDTYLRKISCVPRQRTFSIPNGPRAMFNTGQNGVGLISPGDSNVLDLTGSGA